jgi:hypothetical protein
MCHEPILAMLHMLSGLLTWTAHLEHHLRSGRVPPGLHWIEVSCCCRLELSLFQHQRPLYPFSSAAAASTHTVACFCRAAGNHMMQHTVLRMTRSHKPALQWVEPAVHPCRTYHLSSDQRAAATECVRALRFRYFLLAWC